MSQHIQNLWPRENNFQTRSLAEIKVLSMKNLYEPITAQEIRDRLVLLQPDSERQWGKMNVAQAVAHCATSMEWAVGDREPDRMYFGRILGVLIKPFVVGNDKPMRPNSPTAKSLIIEDHRNLQAERERLIGLIDRFTARRAQGCTTNPHSFFGRLTPDEWAILMYKHLDHHLRQFGV